jgi:flagellar biosynthetic protein FliR
METFLAQSQQQFLAFLLVLARISSFLVFAPIFGSRAVPPQVKAGLSLLVAVVLTLSLKPAAPASELALGFLLSLAGEVLLGAAVGYVATLLFDALQLAGEFMGVQMGFGIVNVIDPLTNVQVGVIGQFKFILAVLLFLAVNGHRLMLEAMGESFAIIPAGQVVFNTAIGEHFVGQFGQMLVVAVKLAAPVMVALLLTSLAEGIIARTVPQINLIIVGFGVRIAFGLFVLMLSVSFFALVMARQFSQLPRRMEEVFVLLGL